MLLISRLIQRIVLLPVTIIHIKPVYINLIQTIFYSYNINGFGHQAKANLSPLPTKVMTDQNKCIYKVPDTGFRKYMYVNYIGKLQHFKVNNQEYDISSKCFFGKQLYSFPKYAETSFSKIVTKLNRISQVNRNMLKKC